MTRYLIAHKVRGEVAYDVAEKLECSLCHGQGCFECDDQGYWWVTSTYGHRAYPFWYRDLWELKEQDGDDHYCIMPVVPDMPADLPEHFPVSASKPSKTSTKEAGLNLLGLLGIKPSTSATTTPTKINRRI